MESYENRSKRWAQKVKAFSKKLLFIYLFILQITIASDKFLRPSSSANFFDSVEKVRPKHTNTITKKDIINV